MATHSSVLAGRIPGTGEPGWAAVYGVTQSRTRLKRLSRAAAAWLVIAFIKTLLEFTFPKVSFGEKLLIRL